MVRHIASAALIVALGTMSAGCAVSGLSFNADKRIDIVSPAANGTVTFPFEVRWEAKDFDGYYVVLFDRSPMRPDGTLLSFVPETDPCRAEPGCPDAVWLADRYIFVTEETSLLVESLPDRRESNRSKDRHEVTIVLLDSSGQRIGESAFTKEFIVERED